MTTFTDKELIKEIKERISSMDVRDNVERRAYEIALASLEEDPVAWLHSDNGLGIPAITRSKNDIARMILTSTEFMADAPEGDFDRSFADGVLEDIAAQLRKGGEA